jgi:hypothetical protein
MKEFGMTLVGEDTRGSILAIVVIVSAAMDRSQHSNEDYLIVTFA